MKMRNRKTATMEETNDEIMKKCEEDYTQVANMKQQTEKQKQCQQKEEKESIQQNITT